jgi:hypothetical protein
MGRIPFWEKERGNGPLISRLQDLDDVNSLSRLLQEPDITDEVQSAPLPTGGTVVVRGGVKIYKRANQDRLDATWQHVLDRTREANRLAAPMFAEMWNKLK